MSKKIVIDKSKDRTIFIITHILGIFTNFIGPLLILIITEDKEIKFHAKTALNWQISSLIYYLLSCVLMLILIGFVTFFAVAILNIIFSIIAAEKASKGEHWKYPLSIQFF